MSMIPSDSIPTCGVVVVAAGRGVRLGAPLPKQFLPLAGRPVFAHSLQVFQQLEFVSCVVLVLPATGVPKEIQAYINQMVPALRCVIGGPRRQDSVAAGLAALPADCAVALVHDAARPFPAPDAIAELARATQRCGGGLLAQRVVDTVKQADSAGRVAATLDRRTIWLAQTPQALRADLLPRAIGELRRPDLDVTDEAMLLEQWGVPVQLVESAPENFKITHAADLERAEQLCHAREAAWVQSID